MRVSARKLLPLAFVLLLLTTMSPLAVAQPGRPGQPFQPGRPGQPFQPGGPGQPGGPSDADAAAGCAAMGGCLIFGLILSVVSLIVWIFVAVWAAKDAKSRGMDNSGMWVVLILFTGVIGLVIYLVSRPSGTLKSCRECGGKRLRESRRCPHCRAA